MTNSTNFSNGTVVQPTWLNDVNTAVYTALPSVYTYSVTANGVTDDTVNFQTAITTNLGTNVPLYIPNGTILTTASITNLHNVVKVGNGAIKRGTDTFYFTPTDAQTNVIYLSTTGNDANDGITASQPVATLLQALTILASYGSALKNGNWTIQAAAGTYSQGNIDFPVVLANKNRITIQGPIVNHPNVPTAIFDGTTGTKIYGLNFNSRALVTISNIKFQNYTTYGVVSQDLGDILLINVHCSTIPGGPGFKVQQGRARVQGGIFTACQQGNNFIGGTTFTVGDPNSVSTANGTQFINCTQCAILAQEQSSGHADYIISNGCPVGLDATVHSRFHAANCQIINSVTAAVRCADASSWLDNGTSANFSGNGCNELMYDASGEIQREGGRTSGTRYAVDQVFQTNTGVIGTPTVVKTYTGDIAKNSFNSPIKAYKMIIRGTIANSAAGAKNITVNIAGSAWFGFAIGGAVTGDFKIEANLEAFGTTGAQQSYDATLYINGQTPQVVQGSRAINMMTGSPIDATILVTINGAGDTISFRAVNRYSWGGC